MAQHWHLAEGALTHKAPFLDQGLWPHKKQACKRGTDTQAVRGGSACSHAERMSIVTYDWYDRSTATVKCKCHCPGVGAYHNLAKLSHASEVVSLMHAKTLTL